MATFRGQIVRVWKSTLSGRISQVEVLTQRGETKFISFGRHLSSVERAFVETARAGDYGIFHIQESVGFSHTLIDHKRTL